MAWDLDPMWEELYESSKRLRLKREHMRRVFIARMPVLLAVFAGIALEIVFVFVLPGLAGQSMDGAPSPAKPVARFFGFLLGAILNSLPLGLSLWAISSLASRFVHDLYETGDLEEAQAVAHRNTFGMPGDRLKPLLIVQEGHIARGAGSTFDRVGGPGLAVVYGDSAAVLEKGGRLTRVVGPGIHSLERFERFWEMIDLRSQRWPFTVSAMTKEGIPVDCQVDVTFKIDDRSTVGAGAGAPPPDPGVLPFTRAAVFNAATSIWVRIRQPDHEEQLRRWTGRVVLSELEGAMRNILAEYRLDWLIMPSRPGQPHPRQDIREKLERKLEGVLRPGNPLGARLLRVELGRIDVKSEKVSTQWIEAWQSLWEQRTAESLAEGEADLVYMEATQVRAQAEMVLFLVESIRPLLERTEDSRPYTFAARLVQTLRWLAYSPANQAFLAPGTLRTLDALETSLNQIHEDLLGDRRTQQAPASQAPIQDGTMAQVGRRLLEGRGKK
jgi:regulator of protease activity HflC (stomatin/prohibitin superfamily)